MHQFPVKEGGQQQKFLYSLFPKSVEICCLKKDVPKKKHKHPKGHRFFSVFSVGPSVDCRFAGPNLCEGGDAFWYPMAHLIF